MRFMPGRASRRSHGHEPGANPRISDRRPKHTHILYVKRRKRGTLDQHPIGDAQQGILADRLHQPSRQCRGRAATHGNAKMCAGMPPATLVIGIDDWAWSVASATAAHLQS